MEPIKKFDLLVELRKELVESQKIRAQMIGFKITLVSALVAFIGTAVFKDGKIIINKENLEINLLMFSLPVFAAIFFDFLISSYNFTIKRIGYYVKNYIEPDIIKEPKEFIHWEEFLSDYPTKQFLAFIGNVGLTGILLFLAVIMMLRLDYNWVVYSIMIVFFIFDLIAFRSPNAFNKKLEPKAIKKSNKR